MGGLRPFTTEDLAEAGRLLAERHATHREGMPLLSKRFEDPATAQAEVATLWQTEGASGAVADVDGRLTGFLIGVPKEDDLWGPNVWVESAGYASADPETVRDLYAAAAAGWVALGRTAHYAVAPAGLVDPWYRLGFGQQHVYAIRDVPPSTPPPVGALIRPARRSDIDLLAELDLAMRAHHAQSPVFSAGVMPALDESRATWEKNLGSPEYAVFVAEHNGRVVGTAVGCALEKSRIHASLARPDNAGFLGFASVQPEARGLGAGRALGQAVFGWIADSGFDSVAIDWRAANLLSSRTWPRLGFEPTFLRVHRLIGH